MYYEFVALLYVFIASLYTAGVKKIQVDSIHLFLITCIILFSVFSGIVYYKYKKDPEYFTKEPNPYNLKKNPFKNILTPISWKIGAASSLNYILLLYTLKKLPLSFVVPIGLSWLVFALLFNKVLRNVEITKEKIISLVIVISGVILMQIHHIFGVSKLAKTNQKSMVSQYNFITLLLLLLLANIIKAYQVTEVKMAEEYANYLDVIIMDWGQSLIYAIMFYLIYMFYPNKWWKTEIPKKNEVIKLILVVVVLQLTFVLLKFKAIENLDVETFTLITTTSLIFAVILGYILFNEKMEINKFLGALVIIGGIYYSNVSTKKIDHEKKLNNESKVDSKPHLETHSKWGSGMPIH